MAYNTKFYTTFTDFTGNTFTVNLKKNNYTGSTTIITSTDLTPLIINYRGGRDDISNSVHGSECQFKFYSREVDNNIFDEIFTSKYKDWVLEVMKGASLYWKGYVKPENLSRPFLKNGYYVTLIAVDGLADLKNIEYPAASATGYTSIMNIIKTCVAQTGIELNFEVQNNIYESTLMTSTQFVFEKAKVSTKRFKDEKDGRVKYLNCYTVLNYVLSPFNSKLIQANGKYIITNEDEENSKKWSINYTYLTGSSATYNRQINITNNSVLLGSDDLSQFAPIKKIETTLRNKYVNDDSIIANSTFDSNISNWTNGGSPNNFYQFQWWSAGGRLRVTEPSIGSPNTTKFFTSDNFSVTKIGDDNLSFSAEVELLPPTYSSGSGYPYLKFSLIYPDNSVQDDVQQLLDTSKKIYYSKLYPVTSSGNYKLRLSIIPDPSVTYTGWGAYFDNINGFVTYESESPTYDKFYLATNTGSTATQINKIENEIFYGDSTQLNDIGSIRIGSSLSSKWNSYGNTEQVSIISLLSKFQLKEASKYKNYLRIGIKHTNNIHFNNTLLINSKSYTISSYSNDVKNNKLQLELSEVITDSVNYLFESFSLNSIDGERSSSSSSSGGGSGTVAWGDITGTLSSQSDLNSAINNKLNISNVTGTTNYVSKFTGTNTLRNSVIYDNGTNIGIGNSSPSQKLHVTGNILASGEVTAYSDKRLKANINEYSKGLEVILNLNPVTYTMKDDSNNKYHLGLIAQDVAEIEPLLITTNQQYLSLNYQKLTINLINAIKEMQSQIELLKSEIEILKNKSKRKSK